MAERMNDRPMKNRRMKKKVCMFCVDKVEKKSFVVTSEKLEVKGKNQFVYSTNLDNVDALVESGEYSLNDDGTLSIYGDRNFYLKDKFVCTDAECNNILRKKSKTNTCK